MINGTTLLGSCGAGGFTMKSLAGRTIRVGYGIGGFTAGVGYGTKEGYLGVNIVIGGFGMELILHKKPDKVISTDDILDDLE